MVLKWLATEIFRSNGTLYEFSNHFQNTNTKKLLQAITSGAHIAMINQNS